MSIPVMMTIAGSDCSAGAGLQADLKAAHAMGAFALTAVTCVVSEAPGTVRGIQEVDPELVADQVRINLEHFPVRAVKTGMLYSPAIVRAVHGVLDGTDIPVVVDPVMIATAGDRLMREEAVVVYEELLLPGAALLTPNLDEAAVLLRSSVNPGRDELPDAAARLAVRYGCPVLLKGGHLEGGCRDVLSGPDGCLLGQWERPRVQDVSTHGTGCSLSAAARLAVRYGCPVLLKGGHLEGGCRDVLSGPDGCLLGQWERPRVQDVSTHGTGCSLSAAVAARLAAGDGLVAAVERGLEFIASSIRNHLRWEQPVRVDALKLW